MPDLNGTAVVMKLVNIQSFLKTILHSLSLELSSELFEVVPLEF